MATFPGATPFPLFPDRKTIPAAEVGFSLKISKETLAEIEAMRREVVPTRRLIYFD